MQARFGFFLIALAATAGCSEPSDDHVFTLYSGSGSERFHAATFDTTPKKRMDDPAWRDLVAKDNQWTCDKAARLFQEDWDRAVSPKNQGQHKFWCEKGRFRK
jgi:hypothetical protein